MVTAPTKDPVGFLKLEFDEYQEEVIHNDLSEGGILEIGRVEVFSQIQWNRRLFFATRKQCAPAVFPKVIDVNRVLNGMHFAKICAG